VVRDEESRPGRGDVLDAHLVDAEPLLEQGAQDREEHVLGQVAVEAQVVDRIVAGHAPAREREGIREKLLERGGGSLLRLRRCPVTTAVAGLVGEVAAGPAVRRPSRAPRPFDPAARLDLHHAAVGH
jgi:hypothetical protein